MMDMHRNIPVYGINKYLHHRMAFYSTRNVFHNINNHKGKKGETQINEFSLTVHVSLWLSIAIYPFKQFHFLLRDTVSSSTSRLYFFLALSKISDKSSSSSSLSNSSSLLVLPLGSETLGMVAAVVWLAELETSKLHI